MTARLARDHCMANAANAKRRPAAHERRPFWRQQPNMDCRRSPNISNTARARRCPRRMVSSSAALRTKIMDTKDERLLQIAKRMQQKSLPYLKWADTVPSGGGHTFRINGNSVLHSQWIARADEAVAVY